MPKNIRSWPHSLVSRRTSLAVVAALAAFLLIVLGQVVVNRLFAGAIPKNDQYQAVFLTNGQVYFGKLSDIGKESYTLKDVYYIQSDPQDGDRSALQSGEKAASPSPGPQFTLTKLGEEIHGPENEMQILSSQVLFWENLKDDSKVIEAINGNK